LTGHKVVHNSIHENVWRQHALIQYEVMKRHLDAYQDDFKSNISSNFATEAIQRPFTLFKATYMVRVQSVSQ
jgi:hypothetical protein